MGRRDDDDPGVTQPQGRPDAFAASTATTPSPASVGDGAVTGYHLADLLDRWDEHETWMRLLLASERAEYDRGFNNGRATACVALAEMEHRREAVAWWREWAAKLARIIQNNDDPSVRMNQVLREIADDQKFMREARRKRATRPGDLSPLEACALRRIRLADPGDPL